LGIRNAVPPIIALVAAVVASPYPLPASGGNEACLECHGDIEFFEDGGSDRFVDGERFDASVHGAAGLGCTDCHEELADAEDFPHDETVAGVDCSGCHDEEGAAFERSVHREDRGDGGGAVTCRGCHGEHYILPADDPRSMTYRANQPLNCSRCHADEESDGPSAEGPRSAVRTYLGSVHGKALVEKGLIISAVCTDCHGVHDIPPVESGRSLVSREHGPDTCGQCHRGILVDYEESIHGTALRRGNPDVPVCTDCHGEHVILAHDVEASPVYPTNVAVTCAHCHDDIQLNERYGLPVNRYKTFLGTYHGIASRLKDVTAANCASCHGVHDILPSSDPDSRIHPRNLAETCGQCHPGASKHFVSYKVHVEEPAGESAAARLAQTFYSILIPLLIGMFVVFISFELYGSVKRKREERRP
jgi:hypothetical protein